MGEKECFFFFPTLLPALPPSSPSSFPYLTSVIFFSKGIIKARSTVEPFASTVILVRGVILLIALLYWHNLQHKFSCTEQKKSDCADTAYFIEGASKNLTARNTLLAGQAAYVLVGFAGVAAL